MKQVLIRETSGTPVFYQVENLNDLNEIAYELDFEEVALFQNEDVDYVLTESEAMQVIENNSNRAWLCDSVAEIEGVAFEFATHDKSEEFKLHALWIAS